MLSRLIIADQIMEKLSGDHKKTMHHISDSRPVSELPTDLVFDILLKLPVKDLLRVKSVCKTWCTLIKNPDFIEKHHERYYLMLMSSVIINILSRLPAKTLVRFKTVCKTWNSIIQNPYFIRKHHMMSKLNLSSRLTPDVLVTSFMSEGCSIWLQPSFGTHSRGPNHGFKFQNYPLIVGISDGLVCATLCNSKAIICNPSIGRLRKIPRFSLPYTESDLVFSGFVFHDNDYKYFRVVKSSSSSEDNLIRGEVYAMRSDTWSEIKVKSCSRPRIYKRNHVNIMYSCGSLESLPVTINGVLYWEGCVAYEYDLSRDLACVAYFDMNKYMFGKIPCPIDPYKIYGAKSAFSQLVNFKEKLAWTTCYDIGIQSCFELWILNEKERSWTMKLRSGVHNTFTQSLRCLGCDRNGQLVMLFRALGYTNVFFCDPESYETSYLSFPLDKQHQISNFYLYTESLVWFDKQKGSKGFDKRDFFWDEVII